MFYFSLTALITCNSLKIQIINTDLKFYHTLAHSILNDANCVILSQTRNLNEPLQINIVFYFVFYTQTYYPVIFIYPPHVLEISFTSW